MKPVDQPNPDDCVRACVATILELPIEDVPRFVHEHGPTWRVALVNWAADRGYGVIEVPWPQLGRMEACAYYGGLGIAGGKSPRNPAGPVGHAVVVRDYEIVHDPHPHKTGLIGEPQSVIFLVKG